MSGSGSCNHSVHPSTFHRLQAQRPQLSTPQGLSQACTCPSSLLGATIQKLAEHQAVCLSAPWVPWHYAREHTCTHLGMRVHVCVRKQGFQQRHQPGQSCRSCPQQGTAGAARPRSPGLPGLQPLLSLCLVTEAEDGHCPHFCHYLLSFSLCLFSSPSMASQHCPSDS